MPGATVLVMALGACFVGNTLALIRPILDWRARQAKRQRRR